MYSTEEAKTIATTIMQQIGSRFVPMIEPQPRIPPRRRSCRSASLKPRSTESVLTDRYSWTRTTRVKGRPAGSGGLDFLQS